jgi:hypothetical protein
MTHPNELVQSSIYIYSIAIHHLLNNRENPTRNLDAFDIAYEES